MVSSPPDDVCEELSGSSNSKGSFVSEVSESTVSEETVDSTGSESVGCDSLSEVLDGSFTSLSEISGGSDSLVPVPLSHGITIIASLLPSAYKFGCIAAAKTAVNI